MTQPTDNEREGNSAWQWLVNGWHSLRDKAVSAMTYFTPERAFGSFKRVIALPCNVASDGTRASYIDGVLRVDMTKEQADRARSIPIRQG